MKTEILTEPVLFVDSHNGVFSWQLAWQYLKDEYKSQARKQGVNKEISKDLNTGPDAEHFWDSVEVLERVIFTIPNTDCKFYISTLEDESDLWLVPVNYKSED